MRRYPRTRHVRGSRFQHGDFDMEAVDWSDVVSKCVGNVRCVVEEKCDGANSGISFPDGTLHLQSRGHYLTGGPREKHFNLFKQWSACHQEALFCVLGERYVMYGEYMYAKHTVFYDALPHYFFEFDIYDTQDEVFLSTKARRDLIESVGAGDVIHSVKVVHEGVPSFDELKAMIVNSHFKTKKWRENLLDAAKAAGVSNIEVVKHTDPSPLMEGLYIKIEDDERTIDRYKFVRESFTNKIIEQEEHWLNRPIIKNGLVAGAFDKMFGG